MPNGQGQILGSRVDLTTQRVYMADVTDEGAIVVSGTVNINNISGNITIGSVSANVDSIYIQSGANIVGSMYEIEGIPTSSIYNNPSWSFVYDNDNNVGSVYQMIGTGSYVNVITWAGYSGTSIGLGSKVTNISSWSVV